MSKASLDRARQAKRDDFYTQSETIEQELKHYQKHFRNKIVFCNCNDGPESNFTKYFLKHFNDLGLKKLITTSYEYALRGEKKAFKYVYVSADKVKRTKLSSGDYKSDECLKLLKEIDIVVTNPPFSKFRDFLDILIEYNKKFLILGNLNTFICKKQFDLLIEKHFWLGVNRRHSMDFFIPDEYRDEVNNKNGLASMGNIRWATNLEHDYCPEFLELTKKYTPEKYPQYDDFQAINVDRIKDIPKDYYGKMGVPITFLDHFNPEQFELLGCMGNGSPSKYNFVNPIINGKHKYKRLVIRRK